MIHIAICDDEKYISDNIKAFASDFFRKKSREIHLSTFSSYDRTKSFRHDIRNHIAVIKDLL